MWESQDPTNDDEELFFVNELDAADSKDEDFDWFTAVAYVSLIAVFAYFVYRQFSSPAKSLGTSVESTPLLINV